MEDAIWEGNGIGKFEGREGIRQFFKGASKSFKFAVHNVMNPIINVQGDRATAEWRVIPTLHGGWKGRVAGGSL